MFCYRIKIILVLTLMAFVSSCDEAPVPVETDNPAMTLNEAAPDFNFQSLAKSLSQLEDYEQSLSQYKGKVVYLDFWASWCHSCLTSMPMLNQLRKQLHLEGFEVIAVNLDKEIELGARFIENSPVDFPVVRTNHSSILDQYKVIGLPTSFIIDRNGVVRHMHQGFKAEDMPSIKKQIWTLLLPSN